MASLTVNTWTPSSLQLRLALNYGNFRVPVRAMMATKLSRHVRMLCVSQNAEARRDFGGWIGSGHFNGWSDSGDDEKSTESSGGNWLKGSLVAGASGMIITAGLVVAALSIRSNVSRLKQEMVPMVAEQEVLLVPDLGASSDRFSTDDTGTKTKATSTNKENHDVNTESEGSAEIYALSTDLQGVDKLSSPISGTKQSSLTCKGIPAPSTAPQVNPVKLLSPMAVDPVHGQIFSALQALKVIESDALPYDLCTRREFARWLVSASNALLRSMVSKVYPAMYIENVTELAFDDITPEDPDFPFIQGLAEAGLISSKLFNPNCGQFLFFPKSPLSRQDLLSWKMALENRQLPEADRKKLYQVSGFLDIDKINPEAWPALIADLSAGEQGITPLAFGCTRLFQPCKAVTKAQAAVALATGQAFDMVSEELARIEAESMAENVVSAHNSLVTQVENDINASFEKDLLIEKGKVDAVEKMAEEAKLDMEKLRAQKQEQTLALEEERTAIETEMEDLSRQRNELEELLQGVVNNKTEISYEKERFDRLQKQVEDENREILRLQHELEVERNALSMARDWAEDEARRAREQAKVLEEARGRWEKHGIRVVVDSDLHEQTTAKSTWVNAGKRFSIDGTMNRARNLIRKLKLMARAVGLKSRDLIHLIIQKIRFLLSSLREHICEIGSKAEELRAETCLKTGELKKQTEESIRGIGKKAEELKVKTEELKERTSRRVDEIRRVTVEEAQKGVSELSKTTKDGLKRTAQEFRVGVGKLAENFKRT
ncbi:PREDICTED: uncharacterized protein LOC104811972 isoform X2 [Tarenaya hassleriana]|uniref:uncharacterized protein LOC104811972 isoform X2 n=1 Tax=Tarenaya hassleriana TaxID=28532 RepID=UPI00053C3F86|nr:PREDICTED: uncharacterized protein LOC104811972 isoform X2 [Tarenaya hassleriana]